MSAPRITAIDRCYVRLPFRDRCLPWYQVWVGQWCVMEVIRISTEDRDITGWGEALPHYGSDPTNGQALIDLVGANPAEHLWDPAVGSALQMALFDTVGRALEVPMHRLLNLPRVRESCPVSWWTIDVPPQVLAEEARHAAGLGFLAHKFKARPWFDVRDQVAAVAAVTDETYSLDIDFNRTLLDYPTALRVLTELDREPRTGIYEAPIAGGSFDEYRRLRDRVNRPIAEHFDQGPFLPGALAASYDGYVFSPNTGGRGVGGLLRQGLVAGEFGKSGWVQIVGAGLTTAFALHLSSVLPAARWPLLTASNIYTEDLLRRSIPVAGGYSPVPDEPGLGVEVDESAVQRLAIDGPPRVEYPRHLLTFHVPGGRARRYATGDDLMTDCRIHGNVPPAASGPTLSIETDDGSPDFDSDHRRASAGPFWT